MQRPFVSLIAILLIIVACVSSPAGSGKITGVAKDPSGVPLPGVTVRLDGKETTVTDTEGRYQFLSVKPGKRQITFELAGFKRDKHYVRVSTARPAAADGVLIVDGSMRFDSMEEAITVTAVAAGAPPPPVVSPEYGRFVGGVAGGVVGGVAKLSRMDENSNGESYAKLAEGKFVQTADERKSTFSIDVDRASYSNVRRFINGGTLPPVDAVRIEELINYFPYQDAEPRGAEPFAVTSEVAACPWDQGHRLLRIGIRGKSVPQWEMKPNNLVFLIDVSGSMQSEDKLPLVKSAFRLLVDELRGQDSVSLVVYAGAAGLVLPPTSGDQKDLILDALEKLEAGGSTAGGQGIKLAYDTARENFVRGGNNRVVLATDGDFNVGVSSEEELQKLIEEERKDNIFLTVLGFGTGNVQDSKMEMLADKGNGNYAYVDTVLEARKVFVEELGGTLVTIARDVKIQVDFDPGHVRSYRLVGYENRMLNTEDFEDDTKDAGELGSGHFVTALYEIEPQQGATGTLGTLHLRYKEPEGTESKLISTVISDDGRAFEAASNDLRFAAAIASYGMLLRNSEHKGSTTFDDVLAMARAAAGPDAEGYREGFLLMVEATKNLSSRESVAAR